jgi:hypothetical protein
VSARRPFLRFGRARRRPDQWSSPHERARYRVAERLDEPLGPTETAWLEAHLAECPACQAVADAYVEDRLALRQLRDEPPEPPRDLWARTAAGIERESQARQHARHPAGAPTRPPRSRSMPALTTLSGLAVVAVVVIATAISSGLFGGVGPGLVGPGSAALASQSAAPRPTALAVGAGEVHWLGRSGDGAFAYSVVRVDVVCQHDRRPDCAPFEDGHARPVTLTAQPRFIFQSPVDAQAVVVGTDANGADAVIVVALPTPDPTPQPSAEASAVVSPDPSASVASAVPPSASAFASASPIVVPTVTTSSSPETPPASGEPTASEPASQEASAPTAVAIISDVTVVGRAAAYSPDGAWFAFSARPVDGSQGPDVYVWHVGDLQARALTTDHASIFASWVGGNLLGSRVSPLDQEPATSAEPSGEPPLIKPSLEIPPPIDVPPAVDPSAAAESAAPGTEPVIVERLPQAFLMDPATGLESAMVDADWQPAVDPTGVAVVAWQGTVGVGEGGLTMGPAMGTLVLHPYHGPFAPLDPLASGSLPPETTPSSSPTASPTVSLAATPDGSASAEPSASPSVLADFPSQVVAAGPIADFDAHWDETGSWLAVWIADPVDPALGRLSLFRFDRTTGLLDRPVGAPQDVTALPGFSIGFGRLAWASPPGQEGEGSRIQIAAWTADQVGAIESIPVDGAIVIQ